LQFEIWRADQEAKPMATIPRASAQREVDYPTSDGKPMAETDLHRQDMVDVIQTLQDRFAADPNVYISGNLLLFYEEGNRRKHVAPDVFLVRGVSKLPPRDYYLLWKEGKNPDLVIEITSKTTKREDQTKKRGLYRDVLKVREYFQFDPTEDYLKPSLQGHRLIDGELVPIMPIAGRLPSEILGLHLERRGTELRLHDPATGGCLLTPLEARQQAEVERRQAEEQRRQAEEERRRESEARRQVEAENERLRRQLAELRRELSGEG
jgi:Uma2 family endonuclease